MRKLNAICASVAVLFSAAAANAGTLTTAATLFATENFGGSTSAATDSITPGAITYSMSTITAVNSGAVVYFTVRLSGGATFAQTPAITAINYAGLPVAAAATNAANGAVVTRSTDNTTLLVTITNNTGSSTTLGLGAFSYTPAAGDIANVNTLLATAGNSITATVGVTTTQPTAASLLATGTQSTVDLPLASGTLATAAASITGVISSLSGYTGKIDLTATPPASAYTAASVALGSLKFTNTTALENVRAGNAAYTLANGNGGANTGATVTITPTTGAFPIGSVLSLNTANTCLGGNAVAATGTGTVAVTSTTASTAKVLTTAAPVVSATEWFVCMSAPSAGNTAAPLTANLSAVVAPASTTDLIATASGTGYALGYNGSQVDVKTYYPAALSTFGYGSYIRIINTGSVAAVVSGAFLPTTGTAALGASFPITASIPVGGAVTVTGATIESILGAPTSTDRPRLRLTAPTNGMVVQYFLQSPGGTITEISGNQ